MAATLTCPICGKRNGYEFRYGGVDKTHRLARDLLPYSARALECPHTDVLARCHLSLRFGLERADVDPQLLERRSERGPLELRALLRTPQ